MRTAGILSLLVSTIAVLGAVQTGNSQPKQDLVAQARSAHGSSCECRHALKHEATNQANRVRSQSKQRVSRPTARQAELQSQDRDSQLKGTHRTQIGSMLSNDYHYLVNQAKERAAETADRVKNVLPVVREDLKKAAPYAVPIAEILANLLAREVEADEELYRRAIGEESH